MTLPPPAGPASRARDGRGAADGRSRRGRRSRSRRGRGAAGPARSPPAAPSRRSWRRPRYGAAGARRTRAARPARSAADDPADGLAGQRPGRRDHRGEHLAERGGRAAVPQPVRDRGADVGRERQDVVLAALAADPDLAGAPVDVVQAEPGGFPGPQPEPGQQQDDRVVPLADRLVPVAGGQQRLDRARAPGPGEASWSAGRSRPGPRRTRPRRPGPARGSTAGTRAASRRSTGRRSADRPDASATTAAETSPGVITAGSPSGA